MEALMEKEEGQVENWNDERLDELSRRVDAGFEKTATKEETKLRFGHVEHSFAEVGKRFDKVDAQLLQINERLDRQHNTLSIGAFGVIAALVANGIFG